jgi:hypothetical protein
MMTITSVVVSICFPFPKSNVPKNELSSICLTRKSATSARDIKPHPQLVSQRTVRTGSSSVSKNDGADYNPLEAASTDDLLL